MPFRSSWSALPAASTSRREPASGSGSDRAPLARYLLRENSRLTDIALHLARILWTYCLVPQEPAPADVIVALGTNDLRVAEHAADLYRHGYGPLLVCTGGLAHQNDLLATAWEKTEAEMYADVAMRCGVPCDRILLEKRATNTAENLVLTRELLDAAGIHPRSVVFAVKPFMQRRVWAALPLKWQGLVRAAAGSTGSEGDL